MTLSADERRRELAERLLAQLRPAVLDLLELMAGERGGRASVLRLRQVVRDVDRVREWTLHPEWRRRRGGAGKETRRDG